MRFSGQWEPEVVSRINELNGFCHQFRNAKDSFAGAAGGPAHDPVAFWELATAQGVIFRTVHRIDRRSKHVRRVLWSN
jgi:hypothetical protein